MLSNYFDSNRHYHNIEHIAELLGHLQEMVQEYRPQIVHLEELIQAVIWHDETYEPMKSGNERLSARQATRANEHLNGDVLRAIIMATLHEGNPLSTIEEQIMADIDLRGLAADLDTFLRNTANIRKEYFQVSDEDWKKGRANFYQRMLDRPRIYYTDLYFNDHEHKARTNLSEALKALNMADNEIVIYECPQCFAEILGPPPTWTNCPDCGQSLLKMAANIGDSWKHLLPTNPEARKEP